MAAEEYERTPLHRIDERTSWHLRSGDGIDAGLVVRQLLGGGRRYEVYRARDETSSRDVVVKMLRPSRLADAGSREAFAREVRIAGRLAHPNLVRLLRSRDGARPYLVLELVDAPSLADHLAERGAVGVPEVCVLGIRALAALAHVHASGVVHLDVKPANLTVGDPPRLLDLGSARELPAVLRRPVGTAAYMSPEQCRGGEITAKADLFGLGATLYEALTGLRPFPEGEAADAELTARYPQLVEEPQPLAELLPAAPAPLTALVHACLAREPRDRPASAAEAASVPRRVLAALGLGRLADRP